MGRFFYHFFIASSLVEAACFLTGKSCKKGISGESVRVDCGSFSGLTALRGDDSLSL